jgi:hypothetical protein
VPWRIRFRDGFLALCAVKNWLDDRSGFWTRNVQQRDSIGKIFDRRAAFVALYLWACMAFVVYLKYKRHELTLRQVIRSAKSSVLCPSQVKRPALRLSPFLGQRLLRESMSNDDDGANKAIRDQYRAIGEVRPIRVPVLATEDKFLSAGDASPTARRIRAIVAGVHTQAPYLA